MYRNDWDAAVARARALETELHQARSGQAQDRSRLAYLEQELTAARTEINRLSAYVGAQPNAYVYPSRSGTILTLGILSLVVCSILGPIAWSMANEELRRIDLAQTPPDGRGNAQAGRVCGIISSVLLGLAGLGFVIALIAAAGASSH